MHAERGTVGPVSTNLQVRLRPFRTHMEEGPAMQHRACTDKPGSCSIPPAALRATGWLHGVCQNCPLKRSRWPVHATRVVCRGMQRAVQAAGEFVPQLAEWIRHTPPSAVVEHGMFTRSADSIEAFAEEGWGKGRVTFVGDAVHATRPTGSHCAEMLILWQAQLGRAHQPAHAIRALATILQVLEAGRASILQQTHAHASLTVGVHSMVWATDI